jgi:hypothetical protein
MKSVLVLPSRYPITEYTNMRETPVHELHGRVLIEKLLVVRLLSKDPDFYEIRRFILGFSKARHWSVSWARRTVRSCTKTIGGSHQGEWDMDRAWDRWEMHSDNRNGRDHTDLGLSGRIILEWILKDECDVEAGFAACHLFVLWTLM